MATYTRTSTNLLGTPGSPQSIAATASQTVNLTIGSGNNNLNGHLSAEVTIGATPPSTNPTVQFAYSLDGTKFFNDRGPYVVPITTASAVYGYSYTSPIGAVAARVTVANGTGQAITALVQGDTTAVT
jgi:hypothetical protein